MPGVPGSALGLKDAVWRGDADHARGARGLPTGIPALDGALALGGLPVGAVTEIRSRLGMGGLSLGLHVCWAALRETPGQAQPGQALCAVVDGPGTLHAPAVMAAGIRPGQMWCVRPLEPAQAGNVALRLARSGIFRVLLVDHLQAAPAQPELAVRRLAVAAQETGTVVVFLSGPWADQAPLPLPAATRLRLSRLSRDRLCIHVDKQRGSARAEEVTVQGGGQPGRRPAGTRLIVDVPGRGAMEPALMHEPGADHGAHAG